MTEHGHIAPCARCGKSILAETPDNADMDVCGRCGVQIGQSLTGSTLDYEYRWARPDGEHAWPFGPHDSEDGEDLTAVQRAPVNDPEPEYFDGAHIERRTKAVPAGPWEPLPDAG